MKPLERENERQRWLKAVDNLSTLGFMPYGQMWRFIKHGKVYDLSCADLNQMEKIERDGVFVIIQDAEQTKLVSTSSPRS